MDDIKNIIDGQANAESELDMEFFQDFVAETTEHLENIEMHSLALETDPENMEIIHGMFRAFHTIKGLAGFVGLNLVQKIAHQTETLMDYCRKGKAKVNRKVIDLILNSSDFIKNVCSDPGIEKDAEFIKKVENHLQMLSEAEVLKEDIQPEGKGQKKETDEEEQQTKKLGEILVEEGKVKEEELQEVLEKQKEEYPDLKIGEVVFKEKKAPAKDVIESIRRQEDTKVMAKKQSLTEETYIRVPTHKVDNLVDMMGELLIIESLIEQETFTRTDTTDKFQGNILRMTRIIKDIQNLSMSLRMVSLKSTFQKINRIARDTVIELAKNVNIQMEGEETEIDRGVAEKILDPLLHLVKNSISHGIEGEKQRTENGKTPQGLVEIKAYSKRGSVYIEISDDGKGLDIEKIRKKALERKLIDPAINYREEEIINFIFLPGFSTAEKIDNISGRGVGLDVVKTEVTRIGGKIDIQNWPGEGCTFILKIPINLAIMNGTIVEILQNHYIIPTLNIKEIIQTQDENWVTLKNKQCMVKVRNEVIPIIPIEEVFGEKEEDKREGLIVILELEQKQKALPIQSIIGRREIVVKPVGSEFSHLDFISGASILGDGRVSLILDIESLFKIKEGI